MYHSNGLVFTRNPLNMGSNLLQKVSLKMMKPKILGVCMVNCDQWTAYIFRKILKMDTFSAKITLKIGRGFELNTHPNQIWASIH